MIASDHFLWDVAENFKSYTIVTNDLKSYHTGQSYTNNRQPLVRYQKLLKKQKLAFVKVRGYDFTLFVLMN